MKKVLKIIIYNFLILLALMMILELISAIYLNFAHSRQKNKTGEISTQDTRANLPNYQGIEWAQTFFAEKNKVSAKYRSYIGWRRFPFKGETINIDNEGIRRTVQKNHLKESLPTVVFLGGSTMWGVGSDDANTIPSCFARKMSNKYHVLNYGEVGYSAYQGFQILHLNICKGLLPDLVIAYDGVNNSPARISEPFTHVREERINRIIEGTNREPEYSTYFLKSTRDLIKKLKRKTVIPRKRSKKNILIFTDEQNHMAAVELLESWLASYNACQAIKADFICIIQPNSFIGSPNTENLGKSLENHPYRNGSKYYEDVLELMNSERYNILKENFINLSNALDSIPNVYIDFCHLSPNGNEIIAGQIIKHMENKN